MPTISQESVSQSHTWRVMTDGRHTNKGTLDHSLCSCLMDGWCSTTPSSTHRVLAITIKDLLKAMKASHRPHAWWHKKASTWAISGSFLYAWKKSRRNWLGHAPRSTPLPLSKTCGRERGPDSSWGRGVAVERQGPSLPWDLLHMCVWDDNAHLAIYR